MKKWFFMFLMMLLAVVIAGCTPRIYGVPQDRWDVMTEQERIAAMDAYKERQKTIRQKQAEQARLRAIEKKARLEREAREARRKQERIDAIYRGEGAYGDLLQIHLEGGRIKIRGSHRPYHAVAFRIAAMETREIDMVDLKGRKSTLVVIYDGSNLLLDETLNSRDSRALRLPYEKGWQTGMTYSQINTQGPLKFRGVDVRIRISGEPPWKHHGRRDRMGKPVLHQSAKPAFQQKQKPVVQQPQGEVGSTGKNKMKNLELFIQSR